MGKLSRILLALYFILLLQSGSGAEISNHVVVVVWDGMRPDFVSEKTTPTLYKLSQRGVFFKNHHAAYVSTTEVNGTVFATGKYPGQSGLVGNKEFRPGIAAGGKIRTESLEAIRKGDAQTQNHYLLTPTVAELLHREGLRTVIAGAKPVVLLHDREPRPATALGIDLFAGQVLPENLTADLHKKLGAFPPESQSNTNRDRWTTDALITSLWAREIPPFTLLWMSEPDQAQHEVGPGTTAALAAIGHTDAQLGRVVGALEEKKALDQTDIIVVSDHAFSTINHNVDVEATLKAAGFRAFREFPEAGPKEGDIMVIGNGGSAFLYVTGQDSKLIKKVVHSLQAQVFAGVFFTREPVEGAFLLKQAMIDSPSAPDIIMAMRWQPDKSVTETPGLISSDYGEYGPGQGMHGSLSPYDLHNLCVAAGPHFRKGIQDYLPTGNIDVAPTVFALLGVHPQEKFSGRILSEAFIKPGPTPVSFEAHRLEETYKNEALFWRQYLCYSEVNGVIYFDEGNGEQVGEDGKAGFTGVDKEPH